MNFMNLFEKIVFLLQSEMKEPTPFGWFHCLCIIVTLLTIIILFKKRKEYNEKQLKTVLACYGIIALTLEILKQISWSFNYDATTNLVKWSYEWYAAPFQLCTTPIYVSLICLFLKDNKIRKALLSYLAFVTILGSFFTIIIPESCFVEDILVNIHTMWLHCGSFVVSIYLLITNAVEIKKENYKLSIITFLVFVIIALIMNITIYHSGILQNQTFNMFYISPYFISSLPVFDAIQQNVPYILYLLIYIIALSLGALIVYFISYFIMSILEKIKKSGN